MALWLKKNTFYISIRTPVHILICIAEVSVTAALLLGDERQSQGEPLEACRTASPAYMGGGKINTYIHTYKQKTKDILHETRNKVEDKDRHSDLHACTMHYDIYILSKAHAQRERGKGKERERNIVNTSTYRHRNWPKGLVYLFKIYRIYIYV